jgi:hypothetical protein
VAARNREFSRYAEPGMMQSIFSPAARRTILEQNGKISAATVG